MKSTVDAVRHRYASKFRRLWLLLAVFFGQVSLCAAVEQPELQSPSSIGEAVTAYLSGQNASAVVAPRITVGHIDSRLRLGHCDQTLEVFTPPGQRTIGSITVGVRCSAPVNWTIYVQATVALYQPVLIARRPLPRGTKLTAADIDVVEKDIARLTLGYLSELADAEGMVLKRSISGGTVLHPGLVQHPVSIRRGERVTILGSTGGIEVRMEGVALADGSKGELIRVRNLSSGREVEAIVVSPGMVQVRL